MYNANMSYILSLITVLLEVYFFVILIYSVLTFFVPADNRLRVILGSLVEPLLTPIRRILPATGGIDFSPMVLLILVQIIQLVVTNLFSVLR
jgi:YggT family protein